MFTLWLGIHQADPAELRLMASTPHHSHVYGVSSFDLIRSVQRELIGQVCSGVEEQLSSLVSGEEGEPRIQTLSISLHLSQNLHLLITFQFLTQICCSSDDQLVFDDKHWRTTTS